MMITNWLKNIAGYIDRSIFGITFEKYFIKFFSINGWRGFLLRMTVAITFYIVLDDSMGAAKGYVVVIFLVIYSFAKLIFDYARRINSMGSDSIDS